MAKIVTPAIRKTYKDLIKQVVKDLNKPILVFLPPTKVDCPNCIYDFVNKRSSGEFDSTFVASTVIFGDTINPQTFTRGRCPVCFGDGHLEEADQRNVKALVKWNAKPSKDMEILAVGREGKPIVRIKTLRANFDLVSQATYFEVDGIRCELIAPPTIRGLGTQEELVVAFLLAVEVGSDVKR